MVYHWKYKSELVFLLLKIYAQTTFHRHIKLKMLLLFTATFKPTVPAENTEVTCSKDS